MEKHTVTILILTVLNFSCNLYANGKFVNSQNHYADIIEKEMQSLKFETIVFEKPENLAYVSLRMIMRGETSTILSLREYRVPDGIDAFEFFRQNIVWTYSGGMPPQNNTYNVGELVLSRVNMSVDTDQTGFIVFSKGSVMEYTLHAKEGSVRPCVNALTEVLRRILPTQVISSSDDDLTEKTQPVFDGESQHFDIQSKLVGKILTLPDDTPTSSILHKDGKAVSPQLSNYIWLCLVIGVILLFAFFYFLRKKPKQGNL